MRKNATPLLGALLLAGAALTSAPALAGGFGIVTTAGVHGDPIYAYDGELTQYKVGQMRPHYGAGIQAVLGDRDDRFVGIAKFYWVQDVPQADNNVAEGATSAGFTGDANELTYAVRDTPINVGLATAGVQWGLWGDPMGFQLNLVTSIGAAWATTDATEYLFVEVGPGVHYSLNNRIQVNGEVTYVARYRKQLRNSVGANIGVRYLFD